MDNNALHGLLKDVTKMKTSMSKSADLLTSQFEGIMKKFDFVKEKKTKLNKMQATMFMNVDKSIMIVFDNPEDSEKFFGK